MNSKRGLNLMSDFSVPVAESTSSEDRPRPTSSMMYQWSQHPRTSRLPVPTRVIPRSASAPNDVRHLDRPLRAGIDLQTYTDTQSNGLSSRIVKYFENSQQNRYQSRLRTYSRPGEFPLIHLRKKDFVYKPRRNAQSISSLRIPPPDKAIYESAARSVILRNGSAAVSNPIEPSHTFEEAPLAALTSKYNSDACPTRSVLDALKEISRKRINNDDVELDTSKKPCTDMFSKGSYSDNMSVMKENCGMNIKRNREVYESPLNKSPTTEPAQKKRNCVKNNDILSSLSSSVTLMKRKYSSTILGKDSLVENESIAQSSKQFRSDTIGLKNETKYSSDTVDCNEQLSPRPLISESIAKLKITKPQPKITLFNKNYDTIEKVNIERSPDRDYDEFGGGIDFVKPQENSPNLKSDLEQLKKVEKSKLSMMLSYLSGDFEEDDNDKKSTDTVDSTAPKNTIDNKIADQKKSVAPVSIKSIISFGVPSTAPSEIESSTVTFKLPEKSLIRTPENKVDVDKVGSEINQSADLKTVEPETPKMTELNKSDVTDKQNKTDSEEKLASPLQSSGSSLSKTPESVPTSTGRKGGFSFGVTLTPLSSGFNLAATSPPPMFNISADGNSSVVGTPKQLAESKDKIDNLIQFSTPKPSETKSSQPEMAKSVFSFGSVQSSQPCGMYPFPPKTCDVVTQTKDSLLDSPNLMSFNTPLTKKNVVPPTSSSSYSNSTSGVVLEDSITNTTTNTTGSNVFSSSGITVTSSTTSVSSFDNSITSYTFQPKSKTTADMFTPVMNLGRPQSEVSGFDKPKIKPTVTFKDSHPEMNTATFTFGGGILKDSKSSAKSPDIQQFISNSMKFQPPISLSFNSPDSSTSYTSTTSVLPSRSTTASSSNYNSPFSFNGKLISNTFGNTDVSRPPMFDISTTSISSCQTSKSPKVTYCPTTIFGSTTTTSSSSNFTFGTVTTNSENNTITSILKNPLTTSSSIFTTGSVLSNSTFGSSSTFVTDSEKTSSSIFGGNTATTSSGFTFNSKPTTGLSSFATSSISTFGTPKSTEFAPIFGNPDGGTMTKGVFNFGSAGISAANKSTTISSNLFQTTAVTTAPSQSVFAFGGGSPKSPLTNPSSIFGGNDKNQMRFGQTQSMPASNPTGPGAFNFTSASAFSNAEINPSNPFGTPNTAQMSVFGTNTSQHNISIFGGNVVTTEPNTNFNSNQANTGPQSNNAFNFSGADTRPRFDFNAASACIRPPVPPNTSFSFTGNTRAVLATPTSMLVPPNQAPVVNAPFQFNRPPAFGSGDTQSNTGTFNFSTNPANNLFGVGATGNTTNARGRPIKVATRRIR